jgi:hypothetical protein
MLPPFVLVDYSSWGAPLAYSWFITLGSCSRPLVSGVVGVGIVNGAVVVLWRCVD